MCDTSRWESFDLRAGDVIVTTPPKCGTTWMQMCCLLLVHGDPLPAPLGELSIWLDQQLRPLDDVLARYGAQSHQRVIKAHAPLDGLPWRDDVVYIGVGRDPRDVALSLANHRANMDLDVARRVRVEAGQPDVVPQATRPPGASTGFLAWATDDPPIEEFGSTLAFTIRHLAQLWARRDEPNVHLFHYADLRADLPGALRRLADAMHVAIDDEGLAQLASAASLPAMRADADRTAPDAEIGVWRDNARFFAEGRHGSWQAILDADALAVYGQRVAALSPGAEFTAWLQR